MSPISRRTLLGSAAAVSAGVALGALPDSVTRARAATITAAATGTSGTITDVKHVVILMQENRSFDHYFGTLQGVRGFGDRAGILLPGLNSVFNQPNGSTRQYPWQLSATPPADGATAEELAQCDGSLDHSWATQQAAWDNGRMDDWIAAKGSNRTMGYLDRTDIPFHYALADAYTICDAYHASIRSATGPNRTYLWSGMIDPNGTAGGPADDGGAESGLSWTTYAETLQDAGVSWKVYQVASDNFQDNGLAFFNQFVNAPTSSPLYVNGMGSVPQNSGSTPADIAAQLEADVKAGTLPQVSWIVANQQASEHPDAPPEDGAQFVNQVLQALSANAEVFDSTVMFLNYDENDGFFDHVPPPAPPAGTADEFVNGTGIGLGFRVPMIVCSPWTRGGWVDSQVHDHTSVIQFMETWTAALGTPAQCPNISAWRRQICGDLTGAFDFANPVYGLPGNLPATTATIPLSTANSLPDPTPTTNALPAQESGTRSARALPYQPDGYVSALDFDANGQIVLWLKMANEGVQATSAAAFSIYANQYRSGGPWQYTVPAHDAATGTDGTVSDYFNIGTGYGSGQYDLTMVGPNRFLRRFQGNATTGSQYTEVTTYYAPSPTLGKEAIWFVMNNTSTTEAATFTITSNNYRTDGPYTYDVPAGGSVSDFYNQVAYCDGWYDFTVTVSVDPSWSRRFTGHIETGAASVTG